MAFIGRLYQGAVHVAELLNTVTFRIDSGLGDQGFCIQTPRDDDTRCLWIAVNVHEFACVP